MRKYKILSNVTRSLSKYVPAYSGRMDTAKAARILEKVYAQNLVNINTESITPPEEVLHITKK